MAHLKLRRASALVLTLSLLSMSAASAATRTRPRQPRAAVSSASGIVAWLTRTVIDAMAKAGMAESGIRIDPNGNH
jgi:hypothetical protein